MKEPAENSAPLALRTPDRKDLATPLPLRESEIAKLQAKAVQLQAQLEDATERAGEVIGQLATRTEQRDDLATRLNIREAAFAALKADGTKIRAELEVTTRRAEVLVAELEASRCSFSELQTQLEGLTDEKQTLAEALAEVRADGRRSTALHVQTQARLKAALATERERGGRLEAHIDALRAEHAMALEQAHRQVTESQASLAKGGQESEQLSARLAQAERSRDDVSANLVRAAAEKKELTTKLQQAEHSSRDLLEKLQRVSRDMESLAARLTKADSDKVDLTAKLQKALEEKANLAARLTEADGDKVDLTAKLQQALDEKTSLAARLVKADGDKVETATKLETAIRERAKALQEKAQLANRLSRSEAERRELTIAAEGYLARIDAQSRQPLVRRLFSPFSRNRVRLRGQPKGTLASIKFNRAAGVEGFLDGFGPSRIQGWLYRPDRPSESLRITLYDGERFLCTVVADRTRADVARKGAATNRCGFDLPVPQQLLDGKVHQIDIRLAGTAISLLQQPLLIKLDAQAAKG
jgi:chromosome segregation ATPase